MGKVEIGYYSVSPATLTESSGGSGSTTDTGVAGVPTLSSIGPIPSLGSLTPTLIGTLDSGAAGVALYLTSDCSGTPGATGSKNTFKDSGLSITVAANNSNSIYGRAFTSSGKTGDCVLLSTYDNVAPTLASVSIGGSTPRSGVTTTWSLTWGATTTFTHYCILKNSTTVGSCTWVASTSLPNTFDMGTLSTGNYTVSVYLKDAGSNVSAVKTSNTIPVDATPPTWTATLIVPDWEISSATSISGDVTVSNFTATDNVGISEYQWAVGSAGPDVNNICSSNCSNMKAWTNFSSSPISPSGISSMTSASTYYFNVRVVDTLGNAKILSESFFTDYSPPLDPVFNNEPSTVTLPIDGYYNFTGSCTSGLTLNVSPGSDVNLAGTSFTCNSNGTFTIGTYISNVDNYTTVNRTLTISTSKTSGQTSGQAYANFTFIGSCPPGYLGIPANTLLGSSAFCVSKFEMKAVTENPQAAYAPQSRTLNNGGNGNTPYGSNDPMFSACNGSSNSSCFPDSRPDGTPWVNITQRDAMLKCDTLNSTYPSNDHFQLITNRQWQAMAYAIESVNNNWHGSNTSLINSIGTGATVGSDLINRGNSDGVLEANVVSDGIAFDVATAKGLGAKSIGATCPSMLMYGWCFNSNLEEFEAGYRGTNNNGSEFSNWGWEQRRTHFLPSGDVIWDVAGNVWEHVRFTERWCGNDTCLDNFTNNTSSIYQSYLLPSQGNQPPTGWREPSYNYGTGTSAGVAALNPWPSTGYTSAENEWFFPLYYSYYNPPMDHGVGGIYVYDNGPSSTTGVMRGGSFTEYQFSGIYSTWTVSDTFTPLVNAGFRCVYNP